MATAVESAVCEHLGISADTLIKFREQGDDYVVLWDEGPGGVKKRLVPKGSISVPKPEPKKKARTGTSTRRRRAPTPKPEPEPELEPGESE